MAAVYYLDYANGVDTLPGLREPTTSHYHAEAGSDSTHTVCAASLTGTAEDGTAYVGAFIYNRTRGAGAIISAFAHSTHTLTHGSITGNTTNDEFYVVKSWKTLNKATTTMAAGDTCYVRAGTTEVLGASVAFTNDGTITAWITVKGMGTGSATLETTDETATEVWHDASTARPIINGNNAAYGTALAGDNYWQIHNMDFANSNVNGACLYIGATVYNAYVKNCIVRDQGHTSGYCLGILTDCHNILVEDCALSNANAVVCGVSSSEGNIVFRRCSFDSGALVSTYGIQTSSNFAQLEECTFGTISAFSSADVFVGYQYAAVYARNCTFTAPKVIISGYGMNFLAEHNVTGEQIITTGDFTTTKCASGLTDTTVRSGGGTSSVRLQCNASVIINNFMPIYPGNHIYQPTFRIWCPASSTTITVYVRPYGTWTTRPTNTECYLEAEYLSDDSPVTMTKVNSTESFSDDTTWVGFSVTVAPHVAGFVNLKVMLSKYESGKGFYADIKPVIS